MIGSTSAITSPISSGTVKSDACSGILPASMREMSRMSLMSASRCVAFESTRPRLRFCGERHRARHALQQHARVAQDRVERRAELVRHVGEELRLQGRGLLELDVLAPEQLVLAHQLGGGLAHLLFQLVGGALELLVEPLPLQRLRPVVQDRHHADQLAVLRQHLARDGLERARASRLRVDEADVAVVPRGLADEEQLATNEEKCASLDAHAQPRRLGRALRHREEALGGIVHHRRSRRRDR